MPEHAPSGQKGPPYTSGDGGPGQRFRLIVTPVFAGSVGLLLLNDHVLEEAWPGWVTGKLSDAAGVAMAAIGLTALIRVRAVAFGLTIAALTASRSYRLWRSRLLRSSVGDAHRSH